MFWFKTIRDLRSRIANLETINKNAQINKNCADGVHEWELRNIDCAEPFTRCKHCYRQPESAYKK